MPRMSVEQRRIKLRELEEIIVKTEAEIRELLEPSRSTENPIQLPEGFSVNNKVLKAIEENPDGLNKHEIIKIIESQTGVVLTPTQIQSALAYLKNTKGFIETVGRGKYKQSQVASI